MPFKSAKQKKFFEAVAHGMKPKGGKGPSMATAKKFVGDADKATEKKPDADERVKGPVFGKAPIASAGKHPKAGGKKR